MLGALRVLPLQLLLAAAASSADGQQNQAAGGTGSAAPPGNCTGTAGVCQHDAYPILRQLTATASECCGNCTANPACVSWNINTGMGSCFLRGSYKPNPGKECISGRVPGRGGGASVRDPQYDCQLRQIALDYAREVVLRPWNSSGRAAAFALVTQGLMMEDCGGDQWRAPATPTAGRAHPLRISHYLADFCHFIHKTTGEFG